MVNIFYASERCEFIKICDCYFNGSYTCEHDKQSCNIYTEFKAHKITMFRIHNIED